MKYVMYHSWEKVGILATGCRRKNVAKRQKRRKIAKIAKIKGKIRLNGKCPFLVAVVIEFFPGMIYVYI